MNTEEKNDFIIASLNEKLIAAQAEIMRLSAENERFNDSRSWYQKQIEEEQNKRREALQIALLLFRSLFPQERFIFEPSESLKRDMQQSYSYYSSAAEDRAKRKRREEIEQFSKQLPKVIEYVQQLGKLRDQAKIAPLLVLLLLGTKPKPKRATK